MNGRLTAAQLREQKLLSVLSEGDEDFGYFGFINRQRAPLVLQNTGAPAHD